jgi:hypothetical protein
VWVCECVSVGVWEWECVSVGVSVGVQECRWMGGSVGVSGWVSVQRKTKSKGQLGTHTSALGLVRGCFRTSKRLL